MVNPFAYLALPIGSHFATWNLGISLYCSILPIGCYGAFNIWEFLHSKMFEHGDSHCHLKSENFYVLWCLNLGILSFFPSIFSSILLPSLCFLIFSLECPVKVLGSSNFFYLFYTDGLGHFGLISWYSLM